MKGRNILIGIILLTSILLTTIVYAAFNTQLNIEGEAIVRSDQDIRITNISISNRTNGAYETYNNKYNKDTTFMYVTLPANSSITYEVEITNKVSDSYLIDSITQENHTNSNVNVGISLNENDVVNANSTKTFTITLTNNTNTEQQETLVYSYSFKENNFTVTFDYNMNLIYGLGDKEETIDHNMKYSINNGVITVTGLSDDGWGHTPVRVYLQAGKTYIFSYETDGSLSWGSDGVEAWLKLNGEWSSSVHFSSKYSNEFVVNETGIYWLRLDVNREGLTNNFWNISVKEKQTSKEVSYGSAYGTLPTPTPKDGYTFKGWNGKNLLNEDTINTNTIVNSNTGDLTTNYSWKTSDFIKVNPSTNYTFSYSTDFKFNQSGFAFYDKDYNFIGMSEIGSNEWWSTEFFYNTFLTTVNTEYIRVLYSCRITYQGSIVTVSRYNIQLEEGSTATEYEPYYIQDTTTVVQPNNHTLTAIWEKNE